VNNSIPVVEGNELFFLECFQCISFCNLSVEVELSTYDLIPIARHLRVRHIDSSSSSSSSTMSDESTSVMIQER
jgi:hypothetical protein